MATRKIDYEDLSIIIRSDFHYIVGKLCGFPKHGANCHPYHDCFSLSIQNFLTNSRPLSHSDPYSSIPALPNSHGKTGQARILRG